MNTMHLDDFVVLGRTVPEESRTYGTKVCMAGYSEENGQFIRVYPLMVPVGANADANGFKARHRYMMDLRRNPNDSRTESWRVADEKKPTATPWQIAAEVKKKDIVRWLRSRAVPSIRLLNEVRASLGVLSIPAADWQGEFLARDDPGGDEFHRGLFDDLQDQVQTAGAGVDPNRVKYAPYINFKDADGPHRLQVREWGAYLLLSNPQYADNPDSLWGAAGYRCGKDMLFVVGNMCNHRNNWLIIKTFEIDQPEDDLGLFAGYLFDEESGRSAGGQA